MKHFKNFTRVEEELYGTNHFLIILESHYNPPDGRPPKWQFHKANRKPSKDLCSGQPVMLYLTTSILVRTRIVQRILQFWYVLELFVGNNSRTHQNCWNNSGVSCVPELFPLAILVCTRIVTQQYWYIPELFENFLPACRRSCLPSVAI